jgi:ArsR family transcriptional regulator
LRVLDSTTVKRPGVLDRLTMTANRTGAIGENVPKDPEDLLPEESVLSLDEYLAMHAAVGHRTRYEILYRLVHGGEMSPKELEDAIGIDDSTLHYHLNELVDVGLVEKRQRTERGQDGLYTYYRATVFGEVTLTDGVDELIRGEQAFEEMYNSSSEE